MGYYSFKLPDLGEGIVESEVSEWYIQPGDYVDEDQHIADVTTDKAIVEVSSPVKGKVITVACAAGEVLAVGQELIGFEVNDNDTKDQPAPAQALDAVDDTHTEQVSVPNAQEVLTASNSINELDATHVLNSPVLTSPSLRRRARELNINLSRVPGSGKSGRICHKDLDTFIAAAESGAGIPTSMLRKTGKTDIKIKGLRRVIAKKMQDSVRNIPHYSYIEEIDVSNLEELRTHLNSERTADQTKLTLLPFIMQALVKVLPQFPHCNAHFDDDANLLTQHDAVHIGIATMTDAGLMVPIVKHCEAIDIWQSAAEVARVSQSARDSSANVDELRGSTITITSLGAIGGIATTPIINAPETAIIGINKMQERVVVRDGAMVIRKIMNISASFDHRIVDGFDGAQLTQALKKKLETPASIFI